MTGKMEGTSTIGPCFMAWDALFVRTLHLFRPKCSIFKETQILYRSSVTACCCSCLSKDNTVHGWAILCIGWIGILSIVSTFLAKDVFH